MSDFVTSKFIIIIKGRIGLRLIIKGRIGLRLNYFYEDLFYNKKKIIKE
jgi:hypothetical protein